MSAASVEILGQVIIGLGLVLLVGGMVFASYDYNPKDKKENRRNTLFILASIVGIMVIIGGAALSFAADDEQDEVIVSRVITSVLQAEEEVALENGKGTGSLLDLRAVSSSLDALLEKHPSVEVELDYGDLAGEVQVDVSLDSISQSRIVDIQEEMQTFASGSDSHR